MYVSFAPMPLEIEEVEEEEKERLGALSEVDRYGSPNHTTKQILHEL